MPVQQMVMEPTLCGPARSAYQLPLRLEFHHGGCCRDFHTDLGFGRWDQGDDDRDRDRGRSRSPRRRDASSSGGRPAMPSPRATRPKSGCAKTGSREFGWGGSAATRLTPSTRVPGRLVPSNLGSCSPGGWVLSTRPISGVVRLAVGGEGVATLSGVPDGRVVAEPMPQYWQLTPEPQCTAC